MTHCVFGLKFALVKVKTDPENQFHEGKYPSLVKNVISNATCDPVSVGPVQLDM